MKIYDYHIMTFASICFIMIFCIVFFISTKGCVCKNTMDKYNRARLEYFMAVEEKSNANKTNDGPK